jgi:hypothetical protein
MKNILKYTLITCTFIITAISCKDDEAIRFPEFGKGVTGRVVLYPERSYVNLDDLAGASVAFDIYTENDNLQDIVYTATFNDADSAEVDFPDVAAITVPSSSFSGGKATNVEITATELASLFNFPGGVSYLEGGDSFTFNATATLTDGRTFSAANSAASIVNGAAASFTTAFTVYVGCPSSVDAIAGTYVSTMDYNNFDIGIGAEVEVEVTFVGPEPFRYRVTDHTAELYTCCGGTGYAADFYDICGRAILQPTAHLFGGVINFDPGGDPNFGAAVIDTSTPQTSFVLNWLETNNGIEASVRFVKKVD